MSKRDARGKAANQGAVAGTGTRWRRGAVLVAVIAVAAFLPALRNRFVLWDDPRALLDNLDYRGFTLAHLKWMFTTFSVEQYHPLTWMSFALDYELWGMQPFGYHLTSVLLHGANAALVFLLARRLLRLSLANAAPGALNLAAGFAALFFALHPLRVETVAWATERRGVLCAFFYLLAVLAYLRHLDPDLEARPSRARRWLAAAQGFGLCALLSKPMAVSLPVLLIVLDFYPLRRLGVAAGWWRRGAYRVWLEKAPLFLFALAAALIAPHGQREVLVSQATIAQRTALVSYAALFYVGKTLMPARLSAVYPLYPERLGSWPFVTSVIAVIIITMFLLMRRRRWPGLLAAWAAFGVMAAPILGFVPFSPAVAADRYAYLPCLPWALLAGAALWRLTTVAPRGIGRWPARIAPVIILAALAALTLLREPVWHDSLALWRDGVRQKPDSWLVENHYVLTMVSLDRLQEALVHATRARQLNPTAPQTAAALADAEHRIGKQYQARQEWPAAIGWFDEALKLRPDSFGVWLDRGQCLAASGQFAAAIRDCSEAIRLRPEDPRAYANRIIANLEMGNFGVARDEMAECRRLGISLPAELLKWVESAGTNDARRP